MRKFAISALLLAACARPLSFSEYREPEGEFVANVPAAWPIDNPGPFSRLPLGQICWLGEMVDQHEGTPIGVQLCVRRLDRNPDARATSYRKGTLAVTDAIFAGKALEGLSVSETTHSGLPARLVINEKFAQTKGDNLFHGPVKEFPSKLQALIIETPAFYYVLEYKSVLDRFDKYKPAFDTLVASFKLTKAPPPAKPR